MASNAITVRRGGKGTGPPCSRDLPRQDRGSRGRSRRGPRRGCPRRPRWPLQAPLRGCSWPFPSSSPYRGRASSSRTGSRGTSDGSAPPGGAAPRDGDGRYGTLARGSRTERGVAPRRGPRGGRRPRLGQGRPRQPRPSPRLRHRHRPGRPSCLPGLGTRRRRGPHSGGRVLLSSGPEGLVPVLPGIGEFWRQRSQGSVYIRPEAARLPWALFIALVVAAKYGTWKAITGKRLFAGRGRTEGTPGPQ